MFIGDIIGNSGRKAVTKHLDAIVKSENIDFVIANGENSAGGFGITQKIAEEFLSSGVDVITSGNHVWDKKEVMPYLSSTKRLIRPANYPEGVEGFGSTIIKHKKCTIGVIQLMGRIFMLPIDCPFKVADKIISRMEKSVDIIFVDFHAEATSEKAALGWYLNGQVAAVVGTHTHIQTADEKILPGGTAYITDAGMTGPEDSVIGVNPEQAIKKLITQTPKRFETSKGESTFSGVIISADPVTGKALTIKRIQVKPD